MKKTIKTDNAPQAIGPYNQAVISGNLVFVSGQIPLTPEGKLAGNAIEEQTLQCLINIEGILKDAGLGRADIIKTTLFIKNMDDFQKVNETYSKYFEGTIFPARSTVEVSRLPKDVMIEIESIASFD
jgi:2-iminobutanoate/2-iminopropanoate deaminase